MRIESHPRWKRCCWNNRRLLFEQGECLTCEDIDQQPWVVASLQLLERKRECVDPARQAQLVGDLIQDGHAVSRSLQPVHWVWHGVGGDIANQELESLTLGCSGLFPDTADF